MDLSEAEIIDILESRISEFGNVEDAIASLNDVDQFDGVMRYYKPDDDLVLEIFHSLKIAKIAIK